MQSLGPGFPAKSTDLMEKQSLLLPAEPYSHILDADHIRLLRIDSIDSNGTVRCTFMVTKFEDPNLQYYAVSHSWGPKPVNETKIIVDDREVSVWPTLVETLTGIYRFLVRMKKEDSWIWVDSVCINQGHELEQVVQLKKMDHVYRNAKCVLIWLGLGDNFSDLVMTAMQWVCTEGLPEVDCTEFPIPTPSEIIAMGKSVFGLSEEQLKVFMKRFLVMVQGGDRDVMTKIHREPKVPGWEKKFPDVIFYNHIVWEAWRLLASRGWFYRVWTLQELVLARSAIFICGDKHVDWRVFELMTTKGMDTARGLVLNKLQAEGFPKAFNAIREMMEMKTNSDRKMLDSKQLDFGLFYLMSSNIRRGAKASVVQDYVYEILALLKPSIRDQIKPDYKQNASTVLKDAFRCSHFVDSPSWNAAAMWELYGSGRPDGTALSWLPFMLNEEPVPAQLYQFPDTHEQASAGLDESIKNHARVSSKAQEQVVALRAFKVDTIAEVAISPYENPRQYFNNTLPLTSGIAQSFRDALSQPVAQWLQNVEALLPDMSQSPVLPKAWIMFLRDLFSSVTAGAENHDALVHRFQQVQKYAAQHKETVSRAREIVAGSDEYAQNLLGQNLTSLSAVSNSSYCTTSSGKFGRAASKEVQPGDIVCFIPGGQRLHILHKEQQTFRRVTTAWFCGWSEGEAAALANRSEIKLKTFEIK